MIDFPCVRHRARIVGASPAHDAPNDFRAMLTPVLEGEDSVSHSKDAYLVFIGYGESQAELGKIVQENGTDRKVRFLGRVEPNQILPLTAGADLGVIPYQPIDLNHKFCSPNKFFEYVQARVPMVTHDLEFFRQMNELHGVVTTGDLSTPEGTARAINGLLNSPGRLEELARLCEKASPALSWDEESKKLVEAYAKFLN